MQEVPLYRRRTVEGVERFVRDNVPGGRWTPGNRRAFRREFGQGPYEFLVPGVAPVPLRFLDRPRNRPNLVLDPEKRARKDYPSYNVFPSRPEYVDAEGREYLAEDPESMARLMSGYPSAEDETRRLRLYARRPTRKRKYREGVGEAWPRSSGETLRITHAATGAVLEGETAGVYYEGRGKTARVDLRYPRRI